MGWTLTEVRNYVQKVERTLSSVKEKKLKGLAFAKLYREVKELSTAQRYVHEYISVNSRDFRAYSFLGQLLEDSQDWQGALKAYKKSMEINSNQKDVLLKVVELYSKIPVDPGRAKVWVDKANKLCPGHPAVFNLKWHLLVSAPVTDYDEMEDVLTEELARRPREASLHIKLVKLYEGMGNLEQACSHCQKVEKFRIFDKDLDWLTCVVDVTEKYYQEKMHEGDQSDGLASLMIYFAALCKLLELHLKLSTVRMATDILTRLDVSLSTFQETESRVSEQLQKEIETMFKEVKGQLYHHCSTLVLKMAIEHRIPWEKARELSCAMLMASYDVREPESLTAWNAKRSPQKRNKPSQWFTMACGRLSQTGHVILQLHKEKGIDWIKKCIGNICTRQGQTALLSMVYTVGIPSKSYLADDKSFLDTEINIPDTDQLVTYDGYIIGGNTLDLQLICWLGLHWYSLKEAVRPGLGTLVSRLFNDINHDVKDLENCQASTLCHRDIEAFVYAVLRSSADRVLESRDQPFEEGEPRLLPFPLSQSLTTKPQNDWWNAAYGLYIGRLGTMTASKQRNIVQCGLEVIRGFKNHGLDARILLYIANAFLRKADEFCSHRERDWDYQVHIESLQKRGFYYLKLSLGQFEASGRNITLAGPQTPLIPTLSKPLLANEAQKYALDIKLRLGRAAVEGRDYNIALRYLNEVETPLAAYEEAWIYRNMASDYGVDDIESLRDHLFYLRKARERYEVCLRRYGNVKSESKRIVQDELEEVRFAVQSGQGLGYSQEKRLDLLETAEEVEEFLEETVDADVTIEEKEREIDQLSAENTTLQSRVSFLEATLNAVQAEVEMLRMRRGRDDSASSSENGKTRSLPEETNNFIQLNLREENNTSGRATPKLETEMSWDSFSPAPLIDKGYFAGLSSKVEKIDEEDNENKKDRKPDTIDGDSKTETYDDGIHFAPVVHLTKKTHATGEEDEKTAFSNRAKLYRFDSELSQWKERGIGELKILVDSKTKVARILMRRDQVLRICANHIITQEMKLVAKEGSKATWMWCTPADTSEGEPRAEKLAARFKTVEIASDFKEKFISSQMECKSVVEEADEPKQEEQVPNVEVVVPDDNQAVIESWHCPKCKTSNPASRVQCIQCREGQPKLDTSRINTTPSIEPEASNPFISSDGGTPTFKFDCTLGEGLVSPPKPATSIFHTTEFKAVGPDSLEMKSRSASERSLSERVAVDSKSVPKQPTVFPSASEQSLRTTPSASATFYDFFNSQVTKSASHPWFPSGFGTTRDPVNLTTLSTDSLAAGGFPVLGKPLIGGGSSSQLPIVSSLLSSHNQGVRLPLVAEQSNFIQGNADLAGYSTSFANTNISYNDNNQMASSDPRFNFFGVTSTRPIFGDQTEPREIDEEEFFRANWDVEEGEYYDEEEYYDEHMFYPYQDAGYEQSAKYDHPEEEESEEEREEYDEFHEYDSRSRDLFGDVVTPKMESDDEYVDALEGFEKLGSEESQENEGVPCVVQMIGDDIFVTFAQKTSRAQRAKAARFLFPSTFYSQETSPPCPGCRGCMEQQTSASVGSSENQCLDPLSSEKAAGTASIGISEIRQPQEDTSTFGSNFTALTFSDIASNQPFSFGQKDGRQEFKGAGSILFARTGSNEHDGDDDGPHFEPIVHLEKLPEVKSGEEGETTLFESRAKLYRFDQDTKQWKERGVGSMKICKNMLKGYCRVLMRRDKIHKICANHLILPNMSLSPHGTSASAWVWATHADYADGEPAEQKLAVKFKAKDTAAKFFDVFSECTKSNSEVGGTHNEALSELARAVQTTSLSPSAPNQKIVLEAAVVEGAPKTASNQMMTEASRQVFASLAGTWECPACHVRNNAESMICAACTAVNPGTQPKEESTTQSGSIFKFGSKSLDSTGFTFGQQNQPTFPIFGLQQPSSTKGTFANGQDVISNKVDDSSVKSDGQDSEVQTTAESIRQRFAPKPDSWECETCLVRNDATDKVCVSCNTLKPGEEQPVEKNTQSGPVFKFDNSNSQSTGSGFSVGQSSQSPFKFGNSNSQLTGSGVSFGQSSQAPLKFGFSPQTSSTTDPTATPEKPKDSLAETVQQDSKSQTTAESIRQRFAPKPDSWECGSCLVRNDATDKVCVSCNTLKPGEEQPVEKNIQSGPLFKFGNSNSQSTGSGFSFGQSSQSPFKFGFSPQPSSTTDPTATPEKPKDSLQETVQQDSKSQTTAESIQQRFAPKPDSWECEECLVRNDATDKVCVSCNTLKPGEKQVVEVAPQSDSPFKFGMPSSQGLRSGFAFGFPSKGETTQLPPKTEVSVGLFSFSTHPLQDLKVMSPPQSTTIGKGGNIGMGTQQTMSTNTGNITGGMFPTSPKSPASSLNAAVGSTTTSNLTSFWSSASPSTTTFFTPPNHPTAFPQPQTPYFTPPSSMMSTSTMPSSASHKSGFGFSTKDKPLFSLGVFSDSQPPKPSPAPLQGKSALEPSKVAAFQPSTSTSGLASIFGGSGKFTFTMNSDERGPPTYPSADSHQEAEKDKITPAAKTPQGSPVKADSYEEDDGQHFSPIVVLDKVTCRTGEETEKAVFSDRAKLFRFDSDSRQWKERGVGDLKILQAHASNDCRLIMRRDQVWKLCANHYLVKGMNLTPMGDSGKAYIWKTAADISDNDTKEETFAAKFRTVEAASQFNDVFNKAVSGLSLDAVASVTPKSTRSRLASGSEEVDRCYATKILDSPQVTSEGHSPFKNIQEASASPGVTTESTFGVSPARALRFDIGAASGASPEVQITSGTFPTEDEKSQAERLLLPQSWFTSAETSKNRSTTIRTTPERAKDKQGTPSPVSSRRSRVSESEDNPEKEDQRIAFSPIIQLDKKAVTSGEENESIIFSARAKMYRFDTASTQWKERGIGELKILLDSGNGKYRLIMRRDQVKKLCANHYLTPEMKLEPLQNSKNSLMWFAPSDFSEGEFKPEKLAVRFKNVEIMYNFKDCFENAKTSNSRVSLNVTSVPESPVVGTHDDREQPVMPKDVKDNEDDPDLLEVFVLKPSDGDLNKATKLLLPPCFYTESKSWNQREMSGTRKATTPSSKPGSPPKESTQPKDGTTESGSPAGAFGATSKLSVTSFAELSAKTEGFKTSPLQQKGFAGQGTKLFSSVDSTEPEEYESTVVYSPLVTLSEVSVATGEEGQDILFQERCKLYRFDNTNRQWKERGVGELKILANEKKAQCRIVMRRDQVLKIGANHSITKDFNVHLKQGTDNTYVWNAFGDISDGEPTACQFAARFKTKDIGKKFDNTIQQCQHMLRFWLLARSENENSTTDSRIMEGPGERPDSDGVSFVTVSQPLSSVVSSQDETTKESETAISSEEGTKADQIQSYGRTEDNSDFQHRNTVGSSTTNEEPAADKDDKSGKEGSFAFGSKTLSSLSFSAIAQSSGNPFAKTSVTEFPGAGKALFIGATEGTGSNQADSSEGTEHVEPEFEPIVKLQQVDVKTGEEDEETIFESRAKLYRFDVESKQWKERGVGSLKILRHTKENQYRLVARREQIGKLSANHLLVRNLLIEDFPNAVKTLMWKVSADFSEGVAEEALLAARFKNDKDVETFRNLFTTICEGQEVVDSGGKDKSSLPLSSERQSTLSCPVLKEKLQQEFSS